MVKEWGDSRLQWVHDSLRQNAQEMTEELLGTVPEDHNHHFVKIDDLWMCRHCPEIRSRPDGRPE